MKVIRCTTANRKLSGKIKLSGSKSISNRVLLINALCEENIEVKNLSDSDDTRTLQRLLNSSNDIYDAHHAGTTFRFLTAYLALQAGQFTLTGSERMKERPIKPLVDALKQLGASIDYIEKEGYPPLRIKGPIQVKTRAVNIDAGISSQYLSALLMIAPKLPQGLSLNLQGTLVSRPYLEMTLGIMRYFGISYSWEGNIIDVPPQEYKSKPFYVEADWSAASYYYQIAGLSDEAEITLMGLQPDSLQGDSIIVEVADKLNVQSIWIDDHTLVIKKESEQKPPSFFEYDFLTCPDIAQSIATWCAGTNTSALFSGLQTLKIKETDRIKAIQDELAKVHVFLSKLPDRFSKDKTKEYYMLEGQIDGDEYIPRFKTYQDHRMAMSLAPLSMLFPIEIENPEVVSKSYPNFWHDIASLGISYEEISEN